MKSLIWKYLKTDILSMHRPVGNSGEKTGRDHRMWVREQDKEHSNSRSGISAEKEKQFWCLNKTKQWVIKWINCEIRSKAYWIRQEINLDDSNVCNTFNTSPLTDDNVLFSITLSYHKSAVKLLILWLFWPRWGVMTLNIFQYLCYLCQRTFI